MLKRTSDGDVQIQIVYSKVRDKVIRKCIDNNKRISKLTRYMAYQRRTLPKSKGRDKIDSVIEKDNYKSQKHNNDKLDDNKRVHISY